MKMLKMTDLDLTGKHVLLREDLNVPLKDGKVANDARILAAIPTIKKAAEAGAYVMVASHLGRPIEGKYDEQLSLEPVAKYIGKLIGKNIRLIKDWVHCDFDISAGEVVILENVRFNLGEMQNEQALSKKMAELCDVYIMDAFGAAHRTQASTYGVGEYAKTACAGLLLAKELDALSKVMDNPDRPLIAIVGGSKVSTKLAVLESLCSLCDKLIVGGGIANTFLAAAGKNIGRSLYEKEFVPKAQMLMEKCHIMIPVDVVCGRKLDPQEQAVIKLADEVADDDMIFDVGPKSSKMFTESLDSAKTILWNGPLGVFEFDQFGGGTHSLSLAISRSKAFSVAGGGDTLAAIDKYQIKDSVSYISTGGGAFLEFVEGKKLPAVAMLEQAADRGTN